MADRMTLDYDEVRKAREWLRDLTENASCAEEEADPARCLAVIDAMQARLNEQARVLGTTCSEPAPRKLPEGFALRYICGGGEHWFDLYAGNEYVASSKSGDSSKAAVVAARSLLRVLGFDESEVADAP